MGVPSVPTPEALNRLPGFYPGLMVPDWSEADVDVALARKAAAVVRELATGTPRDPFFLYVALSAPHNPWVVPDFLRGVSGDGPRGDMCALADWCLGQVATALEEQGCLDDTLLTYTSDHGPQYHTGEAGHRATGPFRGRKNTAFEGGHRIPFVARWPGRVAAGARSEETICLTDLMATLAAVTGEPLPDGAGEDSLDVLPALLGTPLPPRPALITDTGPRSDGLGDFAIRAGRWKLIVTASQEGEGSQRMLFDLSADPSETVDLVERFPDVAAGLERLLARVRERGLRSLEA